MTEDDLNSFLNENREDIMRSVKAKAIERITESMKYTLPSMVGETVTEFFRDEIVPEIKAHLAAEKGPIVAASIKAAAEIGDAVAKKMVETAVESMSGYRSGDVLRALMGVTR